MNSTAVPLVTPGATAWGQVGHHRLTCKLGELYYFSPCGLWAFPHLSTYIPGFSRVLKGSPNTHQRSLFIWSSWTSPLL